MNIIDYILWRGDISFENDNFCAIDALILTQLSYLNFDNLVTDTLKKISLRDIATLFKNSADYKTRCDLGAVINKKTIDLLFLAANSKRFGNINIFAYESRLVEKNDEQFCAMTFSILDKTHFIAFRGTDDTITGWKEDFLLATKDAISAQSDSVEYLTKIANATRGKLLLGGHSKGGNLAIFAATKVATGVKNRVAAVFNMDGPGFKKSFTESNIFSGSIHLIHSFYPAGSIIGMMFFNAPNKTIIESDGLGLLQHDPFTWHVLGKSFVTKESLDKTSIIFHDTFNEWIENCTTQQLEIFVDTLFSVIEATGKKTNSQVLQMSPQDAIKALVTATKIDKATRKTLLAVIAALKDPILKSLFGC